MKPPRDQSEKGNAMSWNPSSWRDYPILQVPDYPDKDAVKAVEEGLLKAASCICRGSADLVNNWVVANGEAFCYKVGVPGILQNSANNIRGFSKSSCRWLWCLHLVPLCLWLKWGVWQAIAKPRSSDVESVGGIELPSYRGDMVNGIEFDKASRIPDPHRLCKSMSNQPQR